MYIRADGTYCFDFDMYMTDEIFDFYHLDVEKETPQ